MTHPQQTEALAFDAEFVRRSLRCSGTRDAVFEALNRLEAAALAQPAQAPRAEKLQALKEQMLRYPWSSGAALILLDEILAHAHPEWAAQAPQPEAQAGAGVLPELEKHLLSLAALKKRTDSMPVMTEWQWLNSLCNRLKSRAAAPAPAEAGQSEKHLLAAGRTSAMHTAVRRVLKHHKLTNVAFAADGVVEADLIEAVLATQQPAPSPYGVGQWCAPGPAAEQERRFILRFEDQDRREAHSTDEAQAYGMFRQAESLGWNCHLFGHMPRQPAPSAEAPQPIESAPTDGTHFLGYRRGQWATSYRVPRDDCDMWVFGNESGAIEHWPDVRPTHWLPEPAAPTTPSTGGDK